MSYKKAEPGDDGQDFGSCGNGGVYDVPGASDFVALLKLTMGLIEKWPLMPLLERKLVINVVYLS